MMTVSEAFARFASRLELTEEEERSAHFHRLEVMMMLPEWFAVERSFYGGSFARHTFAKPIQCADLFIELGYRNRGYRRRRPSALIRAFRKILVMGFEPSRMYEWHGGLKIDYGPYRQPVQGINLVPILAEGDVWAIPDPNADQWLVTDPHHHDALVQMAHDAFPQHWRAVVQMAKCWNYEARMPLKTGFLLEAFALDYLKPRVDVGHELHIYDLFEALAKWLTETADEPLSIAPGLALAMTPKQRDHAFGMVEGARAKALEAIVAEVRGDIDLALACYRELFGPLFPVE